MGGHVYVRKATLARDHLRWFHKTEYVESCITRTAYMMPWPRNSKPMARHRNRESIKYFFSVSK